MLLTIDAGNTNTVFALLRGEKVIAEWRLSTLDQRTSDEYIVWLSHLLTLNNVDRSEITGAIIASVVPTVQWPLEQLCKKLFEVQPIVVGTKGVELGVKVKIPNPAEVGADRLVNAVAGNALYGGPLAIIDFGTATTFDIVGKSGAYLGGIICPGINLSLSALHMAAAKLPHIAIQAPTSKKVTGKTTLEAMHSGIFWGYMCMIEGLVVRLKAEHSQDMKVIATGGLAKIFANRTEAIDYVASDLTLQGLRLIFELNQ